MPRYQDGVFLEELDWWLDGHGAKPRAFVSHAHADHFAKHGEILCSDRTAAIIRARYGEQRQAKVTALPYGSSHTLTESHEVALLPAGHIFGSAQIHITRKSDGETLLYTGDFKVRDGHACERIEARSAHTLIMETTFGLPKFVFPPTSEVIAEVVRFCQETIDEGEVPILLGYSLGKAQEILAALTTASLPVMLHPSVHEMTLVYERFDFSFPNYQELNLDEAAGHVLILPPSAARSQAIRRLKNKRTAMLSGWALEPGAVYRYQVDKVFPLSDHADYPGLMSYVEMVKPSLVYTLHGYASEFARDLRERGIEAWSLLSDNQMDLGLGMVSAGVADRPDKTTKRVPCEVAELSDVCVAVSNSSGKHQKTTLLADYIRRLNPDALRNVVVYLSGKRLANQIGWAVVRQALMEVTGLPLARYREISQSQADAGRTAFLVLQLGDLHPEALTLAALAAWLDELAQARGPQAKQALLVDQLRRLHPQEGSLLVQILTNDMRIGLKEGLLEDVLARAFDQPAALVREAHMLLGDLGETALRARSRTLDRVQLQPLHPVKCMLASPEEGADGIWNRMANPKVWLEDKFDGIRAQLHRVGERVRLYSRDLRPMDSEFPELYTAAKGLGADVVVDGELIAYADGRKLSFADLQKRLGRKRHESDLFLGEAVPVKFMIFDLLWLNGTPMLGYSLAERRAELEKMELPPSFQLVEVTFAESAGAIEFAFKEARLRGNEGLVAKDPQSPYTLGRRGKAWLKLKKAFSTLDVVVVKVEQGHGKRSHVLSDYTFAVRDEGTERLAVIGKAYSGLTDIEIERLTEHFLKHTIRKTRRVREVEPNVVLEIAFDSIQASKRHSSGLALRFPRIKAIRHDKTIDEIDTLENARRLAGIDRRKKD